MDKRGDAVDVGSEALRTSAEHPVLGEMAELLHREKAEEPLASAEGI